MSEQPDRSREGPRTVVVDLVTAAIVFALGAVVVTGSWSLGASWGDDGPQAGYFPFYVGSLICVSGIVVFVQSLLRLRSDAQRFVEMAQLRQVMVVLLPAVVYVLGVQYIGIYVSSALFIGLFMKFVGRYSVQRSLAVGGFVAVAAFVMFEIWFQIPLPKGPLENLLGY